MLEIRNRFLCKKSVLYISLIYTVFAGVFNFPFRFEEFSLTSLFYLDIPMDIFMVYIISFTLFAYFNKKSAKLFFSVFGLTGMGMVLRYLLEYGEVSNERNFTLPNIIAYLVGVPVVVTLLSFLFNKIADKKEKIK